MLKTPAVVVIQFAIIIVAAALGLKRPAQGVSHSIQTKK